MEGELLRKMPNLHPPPIVLPSSLSSYQPFSQPFGLPSISSPLRIPSFVMHGEFQEHRGSNLLPESILLNVPPSLIPLQQQKLILETIKSISSGLIFDMLFEDLTPECSDMLDFEPIFICDMLSTSKIKVFHVRDYLVKVFLDLEDYYQELGFQNALKFAVQEESISCIKPWAVSGILHTSDHHSVGYGVMEVKGSMLSKTQLDEKTFPLFKQGILNLIRHMTLVHCRGLFHLRINRYNLFFSPTEGLSLTDFSCTNLGYSGPEDAIFSDRKKKFEVCDKYLLSTAFIQSIPKCILLGRTEEQDQNHLAHIVAGFIMECYSCHESIKHVLDAVYAYMQPQVHRKVLTNLEYWGLNHIMVNGRKRTFAEMISQNQFDYGFH